MIIRDKMCIRDRTYCSVEKNTGASRFYQGMTARYNIYFNGYESFKAGLVKISRGYQDDYAELLRVFEYSDPSTCLLYTSPPPGGRDLNH